MKINKPIDSLALLGYSAIMFRMNIGTLMELKGDLTNAILMTKETVKECWDKINEVREMSEVELDYLKLAKIGWLMLHGQTLDSYEELYVDFRRSLRYFVDDPEKLVAVGEERLKNERFL